MKYNVIIQKCIDVAAGNSIACEIARMSGTPADTVRSVIFQRPVCILKEADLNEAVRLKAHFEAIGAYVGLVAVEQNFAGAVDDDEEEAAISGRSIPDPEYTKILNSRGDIFIIERDARLRNFVSTALMLGVCFGFWISIQKVVKVTTDYFEKNAPVINGKFVPVDPSGMLAEEKKKREELAQKKLKIETERKSLANASKKPGAGGNNGGGGDPRKHVTQVGVLGIISGKIIGRAVANADIFGKGGFAENIDGILQGMKNGLKENGSGGVGRKGEAGMGFGFGFGSGFGGGAALPDVNDIINSIFDNEANSAVALAHRPAPNIIVHEPVFVQKGGVIQSGRSKASIMRVVMQNINVLRYAYNKRLREKPGLKGKVTCRFAIDEFGKVIFCEVLESNMSDPLLEQEVVDKIKRWAFDKIDKPGDIAEVMYPFVFSQ
jgi:TonB family protein